MSGDEGAKDNLVWFLYTGQPDSEIPRDITHARIDPSVKEIAARAFQGCEQLEVVEVSEGLEKIGRWAFRGCKSLKLFKVPSTVKLIDVGAFEGCGQLAVAELRAGLEQIGKGAFMNCKSLTFMKVPSTVREIGAEAFGYCEQLLSVHLCDGVVKLNINAFHDCFSLRNVALPPESLPPESQSSKCFGPGCHDLMILFGTQQMIIDALKSRFDGLPIHRLCYYQPKFMMELLNSTGLIPDNAPSVIHAQDCLGMTPLHILACSTTQNLGLYRSIVANSPSSLITEDKWGCLPILYAMWGGVPEGIASLLIDEHKSSFPNHILNWDKMVETLCRAGVSLDIVKRLLQIHQTFFSDQSISWQRAARELAMHCLAKCCIRRTESMGSFSDGWGAMMEALAASQQLHPELIQFMLEIQEQFFPDQNNMNLQTVCEELVKPLTGWWKPSSAAAESTVWECSRCTFMNPEKEKKCEMCGVLNSAFHSMRSFRFLVKFSIPERLNEIGVTKWRMNIKHLVERIPSVDSDEFQLDTHFDTIHSKLASYEVEYQQLKDAAFLLELGLWKLKIDESMTMQSITAGKRSLDQMEGRTADVRGQCRINCGADVIIPNVLPYLIANEEKKDKDSNGSGEGNVMDTSSSSSSNSEAYESSSSSEEDSDEEGFQ